MNKTRTWCILLAAAALLCAAGTAALVLYRPQAVTAEVYQGSELIRTLDLTEGKSYSFTVEAPNGGSNTITVDGGRVCVSHATCPDQVCVRQGWVEDGVVPIVCLPNQLIIQIKGGDEQLDAAT